MFLGNRGATTYNTHLLQSVRALGPPWDNYSTGLQGMFVLLFSRCCAPDYVKPEIV